LTADSDARLAREAQAIASALLDPHHPAAGECSVCRRIREGLHPDFFVLSADPEGGPQIKVERVREALLFAAGHPYEAPARVIWVREAERLNDAGENALLKSLEEPGRFLTWILTTVSPESLLPTIRSRCELRRLPRRGAREAVEIFRAKGLSPHDASDAVALGIDPEEESPDLGELREMRRLGLEALAAGNASSLLALAAQVDKDRDERWSPLVASLLRDAAVLAAGLPAGELRHSAEAASLERVAKTYREPRLRRAAVEADRLPRQLDRFIFRRLAWEKVLLGLLESEAPLSAKASRRLPSERSAPRRD
jgi:DNA polymerase-3 subunit delta'